MPSKTKKTKKNKISCTVCGGFERSKDAALRRWDENNQKRNYQKNTKTKKSDSKKIRKNKKSRSKKSCSKK